MLKLYAAPRSRAFRIVWLLEELELPYELELAALQPTSTKFFIQQTPTGKIPTLQDGDVVMCESGAITEYILETYGNGQLAPPVATKERAAYLQWLHFAESTAYPPLGIVVWLTMYREDASKNAELLADAKARAAAALHFVDKHMLDNEYLTGDSFTAADIMMGFTLFGAKITNQLDGHTNLAAYLERLESRPCFSEALQILGG